MNFDAPKVLSRASRSVTLVPGHGCDRRGRPWAGAFPRQRPSRPDWGRRSRCVQTIVFSRLTGGPLRPRVWRRPAPPLEPRKVPTIVNGLVQKAW